MAINFKDWYIYPLTIKQDIDTKLPGVVITETIVFLLNFKNQVKFSVLKFLNPITITISFRSTSFLIDLSTIKTKLGIYPKYSVCLQFVT